jgi:integrase
MDRVPGVVHAKPVRHGRPAQFLFTHRGRRPSRNAVRGELRRAAQAAGLGRTTPHQLRHAYATAAETLESRCRH